MNKLLKTSLAAAVLAISSNAMAGTVTFKAGTPQSVKALAHQLGDEYCPSYDPAGVTNNTVVSIKKVKNLSADQTVWKLSMSNDPHGFGLRHVVIDGKSLALSDFEDEDCGDVTVMYFASTDTAEYKKGNSPTVISDSRTLGQLRSKYSLTKAE